MASDWRARGDRGPDAGGRITRTRGRSPILPGLLLLALLAWLSVRAFRSESAPPAGEPPAPAPRGERPAVAHMERATLPAATAAATETALGSKAAERMRQRREERAIERRDRTEPRYTLNAPGEEAGIAAFPPPGTKPIKRGIVVPDDVELPEGYVRHYQTTDDGRRLPPILMFHPDVLGTDENGNPVLSPEERVVPPNLAPPGLPQRTLDETTDVDERVGRRFRSDAGHPVGRR